MQYKAHGYRWNIGNSCGRRLSKFTAIIFQDTIHEPTFREGYENIIFNTHYMIEICILKLRVSQIMSSENLLIYELGESHTN